eukprot:Ihof_evm1s664 gene=Ihof_evmTU1s664
MLLDHANSGSANGNTMLSDETLQNALDHRVIVKGLSQPAILRFYGYTSFAKGLWCGLEVTAGGKNNGSVNGIFYFHCDPGCGLFIAPRNIIAIENTQQYNQYNTPTLTQQSPGRPSGLNTTSPSSKMKRPSQIHISGQIEAYVSPVTLTRTASLTPTPTPTSPPFSSQMNTAVSMRKLSLESRVSEPITDLAKKPTVLKKISFPKYITPSVANDSACRSPSNVAPSHPQVKSILRSFAHTTNDKSGSTVSLLSLLSEEDEGHNELKLKIEPGLEHENIMLFQYAEQICGLKLSLSEFQGQIENLNKLLADRDNELVKAANRQQELECKLKEAERLAEIDRERIKELEQRVVELSNENKVYSTEKSKFELSMRELKKNHSEHVVSITERLYSKHAKEIASLNARLEQMKEDNNSTLMRLEQKNNELETKMTVKVAQLTAEHERERERLENIIVDMDQLELGEDIRTTTLSGTLVKERVLKLERMGSNGSSKGITSSSLTNLPSLMTPPRSMH